jgi:hypothetical protein
MCARNPGTVPVSTTRETTRTMGTTSITLIGVKLLSASSGSDWKGLGWTTSLDDTMSSVCPSGAARTACSVHRQSGKSPKVGSSPGG